MGAQLGRLVSNGYPERNIAAPTCVRKLPENGCLQARRSVTKQFAARAFRPPVPPLSAATMRRHNGPAVGAGPHKWVGARPACGGSTPTRLRGTAGRSSLGAVRLTDKLVA